MTNKKDIEFESDKVKVYVQQLQAENALLRQANEEKNELLIKLGCPTKATAKRKVFTLEQQLKRKEQECEELKRENELAKQLINWILKFFELTDYDWQYDQNEISFLIEDCMDDKQSTIDFVNDINKGLFKKLTEIKEIAEAHKKYESIWNPYRQLDKILQKISEVENES